MHELTGDDTADATMAGPLVAGSGGMIRRVFADGAYDGEPVTKAIREARPPNSPPEIIIPPRATSIPPPGTPHGGSEREHHAAEIASKGRMSWQKRQGYGLRALGETAMARVKRLNAATSSPLAHSNPNKPKSPCRSTHSIALSVRRNQTQSGSANQPGNGRSHQRGPMHQSPADGEVCKRRRKGGTTRRRPNGSADGHAIANSLRQQGGCTPARRPIRGRRLVCAARRRSCGIPRA